MQRLAERAATEDLDVFLADRDARVPRRQRLCLPWAVQPSELPSHVIVEFTPLLSTLTSNGDGLTLTAGGRKFTFATAVRPVLETLIARHQLSVTELAQACNLPSDQIEAVLNVLVREHLVLIQP